MNARIFLLCALLAAAPAAARERPREYDCGERRIVEGESFQIFEADEHGAHWYASFGGRGSLLVIAQFSTEETRNGFIAQGMFYADGHPSFSLSAFDRDAVAVEVRVGDVALLPQPLGRYRDSAHSASVPAALVAPLLGGEGAMTITFYDARSQIVLRVAIPLAQIRDALAELPPMVRRVRENMADPPNRCREVITIAG